MHRIIFYVVGLLCLLISKVHAQETFETRAKQISENIQKITKEEKEALKIEVDEINTLLEKGEISTATADQEKLKVAEKRAKNIETRVDEEEQKLASLVKDQVNGAIAPSKDTIKINKNRIYIAWERGDKSDKQKCEFKGEKRTTSQFVFAAGLNNLVTEGDFSSLEDSDYRMWGSHFYEWGMTYNTRILKNSGLLHAKYGFSVMYNNLRATDNRYFVKDGNQTHLEEFAGNLTESRLRNVQLVVPMHLEFDFSPKKLNDKGETIFRSHKGVRLGVGGYAGLNIKSKQILKYKEDDVRIKVRERGDFNASDFIYGLSTYVGYGETSLYLKYDLNTLFANNSVDQHNISLGLRFDFN
jgi:hypothetical protein